MESACLADNLALLEKKDPKLASHLRSLKPTGEYIVTPARSGAVGLIHALPDGTRKTLHSIYDPVQEAAKFIQSIKQEENANFVITGMGLGYHVLEILRHAPPSARIVIIEKKPELFLQALTHNDFSALLTCPGVTIHIGIDPSELQRALSADKIQFALNGYTLVAFKPLIDAEIAYYHSIHKTLENIVQENRIDFKTQSAFSKSFYNNVIDNLPSILDSIGITALKDSLRGIPAIIVSAGPSLDKNIHLLQNLGDKALVIAVATALRPLMANQIEPDFVVAVDPDENMLKAFNLEHPPQKTWLLFDPSVLPLIPECFESRKLAFDSNVFLSQWIARHNGEKGSLGKMQSVAHTALKFAQHLGCRPIILTGQDLAFSQFRMHCRGSYFHEILQDALNRLTPMSYLQKQNHRTYSRALVTTKDVFGNSITTTTAMNAYNHLFAEEINGADGIFNATEGGIPISRVQNLCLKEVLYLHCRGNTQSIRQILMGKLKVNPHDRRLAPALLTQAGVLQELHKNLLKLNDLFTDTTNQEKFVREMENIYKSLLQDSDTIQLLQGYAYSGFLQWNKSNYEITIKTHSCSDENILKSKYERDRQFINVLIEASDFLGKSFEKMARQASEYTPQ